MSVANILRCKKIEFEDLTAKLHPAFSECVVWCDTSYYLPGATCINHIAKDYKSFLKALCLLADLATLLPRKSFLCKPETMLVMAVVYRKGSNEPRARYLWLISQSRPKGEKPDDGEDGDEKGAPGGDGGGDDEDEEDNSWQRGKKKQEKPPFYRTINAAMGGVMRSANWLCQRTKKQSGAPSPYAYQRASMTDAGYKELARVVTGKREELDYEVGGVYYSVYRHECPLTPTAVFVDNTDSKINPDKDNVHYFQIDIDSLRTPGFFEKCCFPELAPTASNDADAEGGVMDPVTAARLFSQQLSLSEVFPSITDATGLIAKAWNKHVAKNPESDGDIRVLHAFQRAAYMRYAARVMHSHSNVSASRRALNGYREQSIKDGTLSHRRVHRFKDLSCFGDLMANWMRNFEVLMGQHVLHKELLAMLISTRHLFMPCIGGHLRIQFLLTGEKEGGKSKLMHMLQSLLVSGTWKSIGGISPKADTAGGHEDSDSVRFMEEVQRSLIDDRMAKQGNNFDLAALFKAMITQPILIYRSCHVGEDGTRCVVETSTENNNQYIFGCNASPADLSSAAMLSRFLLRVVESIKRRDGKQLSDRVTVIADPEREAALETFLAHMRTHHAISCDIGTLVHLTLLPRVDTEAAMIIVREVLSDLVHHNVITDKESVRDLMRMNAQIQACVVCEVTDMIFDCEGTRRAPLSPTDNGILHYSDLRYYMCATSEHALFVMGQFFSTLRPPFHTALMEVLLEILFEGDPDDAAYYSEQRVSHVTCGIAMIERQGFLRDVTYRPSVDAGADAVKFRRGHGPGRPRKNIVEEEQPVDPESVLGWLADTACKKMKRGTMMRDVFNYLKQFMDKTYPCYVTAGDYLKPEATDLAKVRREVQGAIDVLRRDCAYDVATRAMLEKYDELYVATDTDVAGAVRRTMVVMEDRRDVLEGQWAVTDKRRGRNLVEDAGREPGLVIDDHGIRLHYYLIENRSSSPLNDAIQRVLPKFKTHSSVYVLGDSVDGVPFALQTVHVQAAFDATVTVTNPTYIDPDLADDLVYAEHYAFTYEKDIDESHIDRFLQKNGFEVPAHLPSPYPWVRRAKTAANATRLYQGSFATTKEFKRKREQLLASSVPFSQRAQRIRMDAVDEDEEQEAPRRDENDMDED